VTCWTGTGNENNRAPHDLDESQALLVLLLCQRESDMKWRLDGGQIEGLDEALADVLPRKTPAEKVQCCNAKPAGYARDAMLRV
jgi:hypothetical protein